MAQRDEGLDRLEAFIAAAAETRANLQRNGERMSGLAERLEEYFGDAEARLEELDDAIDTFDARYGDQVQIVLAVVVGVGFAVACVGMGPVAVPLGFIAGYLAFECLGAARLSIVESGDAALLAHRGLCEASERLRPVLADAGEDAERAVDAFCAAVARAIAEPGEILEKALHA